MNLEIYVLSWSCPLFEKNHGSTGLILDTKPCLLYETPQVRVWNLYEAFYQYLFALLFCLLVIRKD